MTFENDIDVDLNERMRAVWNICELGRRVRADLKIRNRQPLHTAYILFNSKKVQDYVIYCDLYDEYASMISDELNVFDVKIIDHKSAGEFCNIDLKPNFKTLGAKGFGKQANLLKKDFADLSLEARNEFWSNLQQTKTTEIGDITITIDDVIAEYRAKAGFAASSDKVGVVILDSNLDDDLLAHGFVADFRSFIQNVRKDAKLNLTDRIQLEVECSDDKRVILDKDRFNHRLRKDLLLSSLSFKSVEQEHKELVHKLNFDNETISVLMVVE